MIMRIAPRLAASGRIAGTGLDGKQARAGRPECVPSWTRPARLRLEPGASNRVGLASPQRGAREPLEEQARP
jgi:hypothetical protein